MKQQQGLGKHWSAALLSAGMAALVATPAMADMPKFEYSGYLRQQISVGLSDIPGVDEKGREFDGAGELSMNRFSAKLDFNIDFGNGVQIVGVGRTAHEFHTSFERSLQNSSKGNPLLLTDEVANPAAIGLINANLALLPPGTFPVGAISGTAGPGGPAIGTLGILSQLAGGPPVPAQGVETLQNAGNFGIGATGNKPLFGKYDDDELRELYLKFSLDRFHFKLGKQQVVWGETDFFRAMDIIHGYDLRWRSFLETENEELRKPLILANVEIDVPELNGVLQLIYRPGWDDGEDVSNNIPLEGGRHSPFPGLGATTSLIGPYNYHHSTGDSNTDNYGFRWSGTFKQVGYTLNYYRGLSNDPVVNRNPVIGGSTFGGYEGLGLNARGQNQQVAETIFPMVETFGATFNAYSERFDAVWRGEAALTKNQPYNTGTNTFVDVGAFGLGCSDAAASCTNPLLNLTPGGGPVQGYQPVLRNSPKDAAGKVPPPNALGPLVAGAPYTPGDGTGLLLLSVPGMGPIVQKDTIKMMLGFDKNLNWTPRLFGTARPSLWTMQLFDTWILNYKSSDDIVDTFGFGARKREHTTILTNAFFFNYDYDNINPSLAIGHDLGNFDTFVIPSVDFVWGDHWRLRLEADLFFPKHTNKENIGDLKNGTRSENDTRLLGTLGNRDQFVARISYQF